MQAEKLAKYLTELKNKTGLSYETISEISNRPESTVKNLCTGKTEAPRLDTVAPVIYALGGSVDEMLNPNLNKDEIKETSVMALKDVYEFQLASIKETNEAHIANIRAHYEQNINELKENHNKIIEQFEKRIKEKNTLVKILAGLSFVLITIFITLFILEIMHPEHGWIRY